MSSDTAELVAAGPLLFDKKRSAVSLHGRPLHLTPSEFRILHDLAAADGRVLGRQSLLGTGVPDDCPSATRVVDVHIAALRRKLGHSGDWIRTVRCIGYAWCKPNHPKRRP